MCAIAGLCARFAIRPEAVAAMGRLMRHRGPDDEGLWHASDGRQALGHRRLSILDTSSAGHQPMEKDGLVAVFNGEIYNFKELRRDLEQAGERFVSASDTEVLLAAYGRWGEAMLERLNGMFAFAILDPVRRRLFCARDRFGEKPFLFAVASDFFAFASEYKALLALDGVDSTLDDGRVLRFMVDTVHGLDDDRRTAFKGVSQLLAGEYLTLDLDSLAVRIASYWRPEIRPGSSTLPFPEAVARFRDLLSDSVALRLRSDVPLGSCLSGGLDSGAIVGLARAMLEPGSAYHVFTGRFPGSGADEWERASLTAQASGIVSHIALPTADGFLDDLPDFIWKNELPVSSSSQYAQYSVFRQAARDGITVLLDGQGADELLGGYEQYFRRYLAGLPPSRRQAEEDKIRQRYPLALPSRGQALRNLVPSSLRRWAAQASGRGSDAAFGLSAAARAMLAPVEDMGTMTLFEALRHDCLEGHLPSLLRYGDRNSMAHSREVRLPFCDHRLAEFVFTLPPEYLMGEAETKRLLREAMRGILPEAVRTYWPKRGFRPPQEGWFQGRLLEAVEATIHDPSFNQAGWWDERWWRRLLARFKAGESHLAWVLWRPFIAQAWRAHFLGPVSAGPRESPRA